MATNDKPNNTNEESAAQKVGDDRETANNDAETDGSETFPVVGIGASAGGLKAFEQFFKKMPKKSGMAFVLIQHLAPHHESELAELLQNHTRMKVTQIEDATPVQPNHVYVIPPGKNLSIKERILYLTEPTQERGYRAPIDFFFRTLAEDQGENAVCIVLSGTGTDGTLGLKAVKERAGVTMAQDPKDAEYDGMPKSAVHTSLVDLVGTAGELAEKLVEYKDNAAKIQVPEEEAALLVDDSEALHKIFAQLRSRTGHDFSHYKRSTILRRIGRRLQVNQIDSIPKYLEYLRRNGEESQALFKDFLISVTNFFRDTEAFAAIETRVIPKIFEGKSSKEQVRVWVAGCATGEEAYSLAMLVREYAATLDQAPDIQIFATDIDEEAVAFAREGHYPESIAADVVPERLRRFFTEEGGSYRVRKEIREMVLFAIHNLIKDPPFSKLDLISCRNLLIYLNREVQEKVFELFHYAMQPGGYLYLGSSETVNGPNNLFVPKHKKQRIFQRRDAVSAPPRFPTLPLFKTTDEALIAADQRDVSPARSLEEMYHAWTLKQYAPPRLLVNDNYDITHIFGGANRYLQEREGPVTQNILQKVVPELRLELRTALYQAVQRRERSESRFFRLGGNKDRLVKLHVGPVEDADFPSDYVEVVFEEKEESLPPPAQRETELDENEAQIITRLEDEVQRTRARLQGTIEEYETSNEELKASNEELQSLNEELQSTTEELETSKEELQSTNEELITVNQELKNKIEALNQANSDLQNLMASTEIATLFLDRRLHIKRYTPRAEDVFNIINSDLGRPFAHISHKLEYKGLVEDAEHVLDTLETVEREVQTRTGQWYIARLRPYRTLEHWIDGVVLTFNDVTSLKVTQAELQQRVRQQAVVAKLGQLATGGAALETLMQQAATQICEALDVELCKVLEQLPEEETFLLKAGVGWQEGLIGQSRVESSDQSQAGYTLLADGPVVVTDLAEETRFRAPSLLLDHEVVSGISVVIPGHDRPYGVLGAHSHRVRSFNERDTHFLQAIANLLAETIERKRHEAQSRFQANVLAQINDVVIAVDSEERVTYINEAAAEQYGVRPETALGRPLTDIYQYRWLLPEDEAAAATALAETGEWRGQNLHIKRDGEEIYVESSVSLLFGEGEQRQGMLAAIRDITPQKQFQQALRASEARFRRAIVDAPFPILIHAEDGTILLLSQAVTDMTGYGPEELPTIKAWVDAVYGPKKYRNDVKARVDSLYDLNRRVDEGVFTLTTKAGDKRIWAFSSAPLGTDDQGRRLVISMATDVTERQQIEEALQRNQIRLKEMNETLERRVMERTEDLTRIIQELDQFAYVASHDLRTPLRAIDNLAAWVIEDTAELLPAASKEHLEKMRERVQRMETLLNDLLAYSRAGRRGEEIETVDTGELVDKIIDILAPPPGFTVSVAPDMPSLTTIRPLLEMVLRNLIDNAIKHHDRADGRISISARPVDDGVEFTISDDGPGIEPEYHERIFQIFQTLRSKDKSEGSGMGLAIVKKVIEGRGGRISLESTAGEGTTFRFTWPGA